MRCTESSSSSNSRPLVVVIALVAFWAHKVSLVSLASSQTVEPIIQCHSVVVASFHVGVVVVT